MFFPLVVQLVVRVKGPRPFSIALSALRMAGKIFPCEVFDPVLNPCKTSGRKNFSFLPRDVGRLWLIFQANSIDTTPWLTQSPLYCKALPLTFSILNTKLYPDLVP